MPHCFIKCVIAKYEVSPIPWYSPNPCEMNRSLRWAQSLESSSLSEPAVELRGLANGISSAARRSSLSRISSELVMYTSPRTSSKEGGLALERQAEPRGPS